MGSKAFVSGCFDMLHSGHVEFFHEAAQYGDLYVALGSDKTIFDLKGRSTVNSEQERLFMIKSVSFVRMHLSLAAQGFWILRPSCVR
jgi:cytidyltransferase-like protein